MHAATYAAWPRRAQGPPRTQATAARQKHAVNPVPCVNVALLAACPGAAHGFFGRHGGASAAPLDSLNISSRVGDSRAAVQENRLRLRRAAGLEAARFLSLSQVHGRNIVQVGGETFAAIEADGVWTRAPQLALCIQTADCVPLLFADVQGELVAAAHAGWRGTQAQIGAAMVERLAAAAVAPSRLRVALGPAIGPCCFLIGHDVAQALRGSVAGGDAYVQP
ncbi:MAG: laccase domain-containing protein, partial [Acetobacteraceae bacterium]